jgi:PKD repeat protein
MAKQRLLSATGVAAVLALLAACTVHKTEAPPLTGPSELGTSITVQVTPDVLTQDGASQSLVTITARNANGQPIANLPLRAEIMVNGAIADFGTLSAHNIVTDSSGRAQVTFTAPAAPAVNFDTGTIVSIAVTPSGSDFANANARTANIRLVPPGTSGLPPSPLRADFTAPSAAAGDSAVFTATVVDANGVDATSQVTRYSWTFGDGGTASGQTVTHTFTSPGSFPVTLTITDTLGRVATVSKTITVGQPNTGLGASFVFSPNPPQLTQPVHFDASTSTVNPPHRIVSYTWNFGEGTVTTTSSARIDFTYTLPRTYVVVLTVTDDTGQTKTTSQSITPTPVPQGG